MLAKGPPHNIFAQGPRIGATPVLVVKNAIVSFLLTLAPDALMLTDVSFDFKNLLVNVEMNKCCRNIAHCSQLMYELKMNNKVND